MVSIKNNIKYLRKVLLEIKIVTQVLGVIWHFIPNPLRTRLPIKSTAIGFLGFRKSFRWTLDPRDLISQQHFSKGFSTYEPLTQEVLYGFFDNTVSQKPLEFLNIGANTGLWGLLIGKKYPDVKVTLIEPIPTNLIYLKRNMKINNLNPKIYEFAAGRVKESSLMYENADLFGMASLNPIHVKPVEVLMDRVDDNILSEIDIAIIDVEGHELEVLLGMERIFHICLPVVIVEIAPHNYEPIVEFMMQFGYGEPRWLGKVMKFGPKERNFVFQV